MITTMPIIRMTRYAAAAIGIFFSLAAIGGFLLGILARNGDFLAIACLSAGVALACALWWFWGQEPIMFKSINLIVLVSATTSAGLALYSNLVYGIWALGWPMSIGTVATGQMKGLYWLGPFTILYALLGYLLMKAIVKRGPA